MKLNFNDLDYARLRSFMKTDYYMSADSILQMIETAILQDFQLDATLSKNQAIEALRRNLLEDDTILVRTSSRVRKSTLASKSLSDADKRLFDHAIESNSFDVKYLTQSLADRLNGVQTEIVEPMKLTRSKSRFEGEYLSNESLEEMEHEIESVENDYGTEDFDVRSLFEDGAIFDPNARQHDDQSEFDTFANLSEDDKDYLLSELYAGFGINHSDDDDRYQDEILPANCLLYLRADYETQRNMISSIHLKYLEMMNAFSKVLIRESRAKDESHAVERLFEAFETAPDHRLNLQGLIRKFEKDLAEGDYEISKLKNLYQYNTEEDLDQIVLTIEIVRKAILVYFSNLISGTLTDFHEFKKFSEDLFKLTEDEIEEGNSATVVVRDRAGYISIEPALCIKYSKSLDKRSNQYVTIDAIDDYSRMVTRYID